VSQLRAYILCITNRDIKLYSKHYSKEANKGAGQLLHMDEGTCVEEQLVQRSSAQKRQRLETEVDPLLGYETSSQVGPGQDPAPERVVQQGEQQGVVHAQPPISSMAAASCLQQGVIMRRGGFLQRGSAMQRQLRLTDMNISQGQHTAILVFWLPERAPWNIKQSNQDDKYPTLGKSRKVLES